MTVLESVLCVLIVAAAATLRGAASGRPHIVIILGDDIVSTSRRFRGRYIEFVIMDNPGSCRLYRYLGRALIICNAGVMSARIYLRSFFPNLILKLFSKLSLWQLYLKL